MPISIETDIKGVAAYSPNTDATAAHIAKGKAKKRTLIPNKHTSPIWSSSLIPIYKIGNVSLSQVNIVFCRISWFIVMKHKPSRELCR